MFNKYFFANLFSKSLQKNEFKHIFVFDGKNKIDLSLQRIQIHLWKHL